MGYNKKQGNQSAKREEYTNTLSNKDRIEVKMWKIGGKVVKFGVIYLRKCAGEWLRVKRYDNAHLKKGKVKILEPHFHTYGYKEKELYKTPLAGEPAMILTAAIEDIKNRRAELLESYFNKPGNKRI